MGIKLDWEIEAEQSQVQSAGEDRESQRRRRLARVRLLMFIGFVLVLLGGIAGAVVLRLRSVDQGIEQLLRDTIDTEVAALRIGDRPTYLGIQRSATEDWLIRQEQLFDDYQNLKATQDIRLTGRILDLVVDGRRARARLEEIINGVPYSRLWFYWHYEEGWKHVPADYTFWGDVQTVEQGGVNVRYRAVDAAYGQAVAAQLASWIDSGCALVSCASLPEITVEIIPDEALQPGWSAANPWLAQVPSPSVRRARVDLPFDIDHQLPIARLLAQRLVAQATNNLHPVPLSDAAFLHDSVVAYLVGQFTQTQTNAFLIDSLVSRHGPDAVSRLLQIMEPTADIGMVAQAAGVASLEQADVDWRDFLTWRLGQEQILNFNRDQAGFMALYDTGDPSALSIAQGRFNASLPPESITVVSATPEIDPNGVPHLRARVQIGTEVNLREEEVIFRLVSGAWRRVN